MFDVMSSTGILWTLATFLMSVSVFEDYFDYLSIDYYSNYELIQSKTKMVDTILLLNGGSL